MKTQKPNNTTTTTTTTGKLPVAPSLEIVEAAVLMADISGFSSLSEKLRNEFGDTEGNERFAEKVGNVFAALVLLVQRYGGEVSKFAGDCLICIFVSDDDEEDEDEETSCFNRAKQCCRIML